MQMFPAALLEPRCAPAYPVIWILVREIAMQADAVNVRFVRAHVVLDLADGRAVPFPLHWFSILEAATTAEREHFAISMDHQQVYWPELDEDMNVTALLHSSGDTPHH
jgi:Protein of unknown function (DUF2442)